MRSYKDFHESVKKGEEFYLDSLHKAEEDSHGDDKTFIKLARGFTGKSKNGLNTCVIFTEILKNIKEKT